MRNNCVLKFSVKVNLKRLGGFLKLEIVYLHAHMYMCSFDLHADTFTDFALLDQLNF